MLPKDELDEIVRRIVAEYDPDRVVLFGSYAKGSPSNTSDLDLLVVRDSELPQHMRGQSVKRLFYGSPVPLELLFYTNEEIEELTREPLSFLSNILRTGKELYSKSKR